MQRHAMPISTVCTPDAGISMSEVGSNILAANP
jgi:hypothetical protein